MNIIYVRGSHGVLTVDRRTGYIIEADHWTDAADPDEGYHDIALFDPAPFARWPGWDDFDILSTGYWTLEGAYAVPLVPVYCDDAAEDRLDPDWKEVFLLPPSTTSPEYRAELEAA